MRFWKYLLNLLFLVLVALVIAITQAPDKNLHIIACDVGQGDGILVTYGEVQILTDGGPDKSILECLGKHIPFWDREIELVILTHSDSDHATGLVSVLQSYKVNEILINPLDPGTQVYKVLKNEVRGGGVKVVNPSAGMKLRLGLIYLDILSPSEDLITQNPKLKIVEGGEEGLGKYLISDETNLYSIVYLLRFGKFKGLFTGDMPPSISDSLAANTSISTLDYIKIPHHGSINGLTENLLKVVVPKIAAISVGKNQWGHPRTEILEMLGKYDVKVFRTDEMGDIEVVTNGEKVWMMD